MIRLLTTAFLFSCSLHAFAFDKYAYAPIHQMDFGDGLQSGNLNEHLNKIGYKKIKVIYHDQFLDNNNQPDPQKIKKIAEAARFDMTPVSFDYEKGNPNIPKTMIEPVKQTLILYKKYGGQAPVGLYALFPRNTHGGERMTERRKTQYRENNKEYAELVKYIDFISPSLYNYDLRDFNSWKKAVDFSLEEARKYSQGKPIIPYVTASYYLPKSSDGKIKTIQLTETEMKQRLDYLKAKKVDGVIFWESAVTYDEKGERPAFRIKSGWGKAIYDFK
ncbi:hypothetical protein [Acinetobacter baumannii]|uniref:hypothetical protein n=3 Tax=Acinetobacter baumannii TaxID=470 RepID=UPI0010FE6709|nr:hypothetical protein [Acinetobacter baumannii]MBU0372137.1 hypothetical protein [Acinetobacter baumannii]MTG92783.1 hypothetical protein [Acinetobacter baumannii]TLT42829.1 hypothetical protein FD883_06930 [Acinetobacter baumannii]TPS81104.1 hypothetical protein FJU79_18460 [Acinetobacter baumannii]UMM96265.1 hypothetical protein L2Z45_07245 [Acinetobacter baumannii]